MSELYDSERVAAAISAAALGRGVDREAAVALVDRSLLVYDERGEALNVCEAVDTLLACRPYLEGSAEVTEERRREQAQRDSLATRYAASFARMQERVRLHEIRNPRRRSLRGRGFFA
jgi:hypothetical protein